MRKTNYPGALENYLAVLDDFTNFPAVAQTMGERALYQSLRADLALGDVDSAGNVLALIQTNSAAIGAGQAPCCLVKAGRTAVARRRTARNLTATWSNIPIRPCARRWHWRSCAPTSWKKTGRRPSPITPSWLDDFPTNPSARR